MSSGVLLALPSCLLPVSYSPFLPRCSLFLVPFVILRNYTRKLLACRPRMNELKLERRAKSP